MTNFVEFNPSRLLLARQRRGMSKSELARQSDVSLRALAYYENGERTPPDDILQRLATVLQFPVSFFFAPDLEQIDLKAASFRSLSTMSASQRDAALAAGTLAIALEQWIQKSFDLPKPLVPKLPSDNPEIAAQMLRVEWGIGERPVSNMVQLAEVNGIRVFSLPIDSTSVDAFSVWNNQVPFIFLNTLKSGEHGRMDVSHEIGHLTMHSHGEPKGRQAELEATRFGSAFLMPARDVVANVRRNIKLTTIQQLKKRWQVSAIALVVRLYHLNLLTEWQYRNFCIELSKTNQRKQELNGIARESSQVLNKVFQTLRAEGMSRHAVARDLNMSSDELNALISGLTMSSVPDSGSVEPSANKPEPAEKPRLYVVPKTG